MTLKWFFDYFDLEFVGETPAEVRMEKYLIFTLFSICAIFCTIVPIYAFFTGFL